MTGWDIYDCHKCPNKKKIIKNYKNKNKIKILNFKFFWLGSLDPAYVRGVKHTGHYQITVALSACSNPQVHELLIRCSNSFFFFWTHTTFDR
jgi:hypothetical protein